MDRLGGNPRLRMILASLKKRGSRKKDRDREVFENVSRLLDEGGKVVPGKV